MTKAEYQKQLEAGPKHLAKNDPQLKPLVAHYGPATIKPHTNYYQELVESIISQQLSVKAADTILKRFVALFGTGFPTPAAILKKDVATLRTAGLSNAKANYIHDLARHITSGQLEVEKLPSLSNEEIMQELTDVKGIGQWTAHMFLMFCLGRLGVLAVGDLGIRNGVMKLYKLKELPDADTIQKIADEFSWHPYETLACWYIWRSLDNLPAIT